VEAHGHHAVVVVGTARPPCISSIVHRDGRRSVWRPCSAQQICVVATREGRLCLAGTVVISGSLHRGDDYHLWMIALAE
jgi:hypothetical protein